MSKRDQGRATKRQRILDFLAGGTVADVHKLALVIGLTPRNAMGHIKALREEKLVRIDRWYDVDAACIGRETYPRPYYGLGSAPDAVHKGEVSKKDASKKYRRRLSADPEKKEKHLALRRANDPRKRLKKADPLVQALFGGLS